MHEDDDELPAWCLSEESENEQWQEVASKKSTLKLKKVAHESLLSVENKSCPPPRKVIEVQDNLGEHQGHRGQKELQGMHVVPAEMFPASEAGPHDRKQRNSLQQMEKKVEDLGEKNHTVQVR